VEATASRALRQDHFSRYTATLASPKSLYKQDESTIKLNAIGKWFHAINRGSAGRTVFETRADVLDLLSDAIEADTVSCGTVSPTTDTMLATQLAAAPQKRPLWNSWALRAKWRVVRIRNTNGQGHTMSESCKVCARAPSHPKKERTRRTQPDPFEQVWPEIEARLNEAPQF
jgi:hypothetical protein